MSQELAKETASDKLYVFFKQQLENNNRKLFWVLYDFVVFMCVYLENFILPIICLFLVSHLNFELKFRH